MADAARILETGAMAEARAALAEFALAVDRTLSEADGEIQRMSDWLRLDRPAHWKREVRVRQEDLLRAKSELSRKMLAAAPDPARALEERRAVERAKARLEEAVRRQENSRKWAAVWEREAMAYKAPAHLLREAVTARIPAALGRIDRMMRSVDEYLRIAAPPSPGKDAGPLATPAAGESPGAMPGSGGGGAAGMEGGRS
jgi:hypothetical protein